MAYPQRLKERHMKRHLGPALYLITCCLALAAAACSQPESATVEAAPLTDQHTDCKRACDASYRMTP